MTYFDLVQKNNLEGIVLKQADSKTGSRSHYWMKVIADAYITDLRKNEFGLLLAVGENGTLKPGGVMEFMVPEAKKEFYKKY